MKYYDNHKFLLGKRICLFGGYAVLELDFKMFSIFFGCKGGKWINFKKWSIY